jgi:sensor histidine kinase YesM
MASMLWGFVTSGLVIFFLFSSLVYIQSRQKTFLYYALYNILLAGSLLYNSPYIPVSVTTEFRNSSFFPISWFIQIVYNTLLFFFYFEFLEIKNYFPRYSRILSRFLILLSVSSFLLLVFSVYSEEVILYRNFFVYGFLPLISVLVLTALYVTSRIPNRLKYFIITGVIVYQVFAYVALFKTMTQASGVGPIVYFYIGIIIESTIFMLGLGYKVKLLYLEKILAQEKIIEEQQANQQLRENHRKELESQLEEKISELKEALQKNEEERLHSLTLSFENEISLLKLDALRSQMNPHFIFNALNSIKAYLIDNNKEKAVYYLNKFAKLIRKILEGSRTDSVTLEEELETIELYLNIENIRFDNTINFMINSSDKVNLSATRLPALILQPFIENALWHGLMLKEGEKNITIGVTSNNGITCLTITDNGIGRVKAKERSDKKSFKKESLGIQFAQERLNFFNRKYNTNYSFSISDMYDENTDANGTRVVFFFQMNQSSLPAI